MTRSTVRQYYQDRDLNVDILRIFNDLNSWPLRLIVRPIFAFLIWSSTNSSVPFPRLTVLGSRP